MRKGYNDFILVLVIAIVLLVALYIVGFFVPPGDQFRPEVNVIEQFPLGTVGYLTELPARSTNLGTLVLGEKQREQLRSIPRLELITNIFGGNREEFTVTIPDYLLETQDGVIFEFTITDTNEYNNLVIEWNGIKVFNRVHRTGLVSVNIDDQFVKAQNSLTIYAAGPGAYFWGATVYRIADFTVNLEYGPARLYTFELLPSELEAFDRGEISFFGTGIGTALIKINGVEIFNQNPTGNNRANFTITTVPLKAGDNIISFTAPGTVTLHETTVDLYLFGSQFTRTRSFELTSSHIQAITSRGGVIEFDVQSIDRTGVLTVELNEKVVEQFTSLLIGTNSLSFTADYVQEGTNTISFSGTGSFDISQVRIGHR